MDDFSTQDYSATKRGHPIFQVKMNSFKKVPVLYTKKVALRLSLGIMPTCPFPYIVHKSRITKWMGIQEEKEKM